MTVSNIDTTNDGYILAHYSCEVDSCVQGAVGLPVRTSYYYNTETDYAIRRGWFYFNTSSIPVSATVTQIQLTVYTLGAGEALAQDNIQIYLKPLNDWPYASAYDIWYAIANEGAAYTNDNYYITGSHTTTLGSQAITDYTSHRSWFAVGMSADEAGGGELDFHSLNDPFFSHPLASLSVTYTTSAARRRASVVFAQ